MRYSDIDKTGFPHKMMRNAFVETPTNELKEEIDKLKNDLFCTRMELDTAEWELSYRKQIKVIQEEDEARERFDNGQFGLGA